MKNIVLGAGVTGLACATVLQDAGESVTVLEQEATPGGLARSEKKTGYVFDFVGGHIFNTKWPDVKAWFFRFLPEPEWQFNIRQCKVWYRNKIVTDYPFELGLFRLPVEERIDCLADFFEQQIKQEAEPSNLHDWFIWRFGRAIAEKYLIPYNVKIWGIEAKELSSIWVQGKIPLPSPREILTATLSNNSSEEKTAHSKYYYPNSLGLQHWLNNIAATIEDLKLNTVVESIQKTASGWLVNGELSCRRLISTIPLPELIKALGDFVPEKIKQAVAALKYTSWTCTYFDYDVCQPVGEFLSWIYLADPQVHANRFSNHGSFAQGMMPEGHALMAAYNEGLQTPQFAQEDARKYIPDLGQPLANYHTKYAYVVYDFKREEAVQQIHQWCQEIGIVLLGRFAWWDYSNMDVCVHKVFAWAEKQGLKK